VFQFCTGARLGSGSRATGKAVAKRRVDKNQFGADRTHAVDGQRRSEACGCAWGVGGGRTFPVAGSPEVEESDQNSEAGE
jgi:hypothetical protein